MMRKLLVMCVGAALLTGCAAPALRPVRARDQLLASPQIASWYEQHSAPAVLETMAPRAARRWRKYHPALMFDRVKEGLLARLEADFGPAPRALTVLIDGRTGAIRSVTAK